MHIVTLSTCHNRRDFTIAALSDLYAQELPEGVSLSHVIVDDGSTDGTAKAVQNRFPDVEIVKGGGNLYWAGGMRYGWEQSVARKTFDYLFVYNDDVRLFKTAISVLLGAGESILDKESNPCVIAGSFKSIDGTMTTYGGRRRSSGWHPLKFAYIVEPNGELQEADTLNMNGALISRAALSKVGLLSDYFIHSGADFEYGLKLTKSGGVVYVAPRHIGTCDLNAGMNLPDELSVTLRQRIRLLADLKREPFSQRLKYYRQHGGLFWPILLMSPFLTVWIRHVWFSIVRMTRSREAKSYE